MRAIVTGASGLIGAAVVRGLLAHGVDVRAVVRETSNLVAIDGLDVELRQLELADAAALVDAARGCELLFHTAMHFTYDRRRDVDLHAALNGTEHALRAARAAGVRRAVVTSSSVVFGYGFEPGVRDESQPLVSAASGEAYADAKVRQHEAALALGTALGLEVVVVCPTVSVGPHSTSLGPSNGLILAYLSDPLRSTFPGGCNIVSTRDVAAGHWLAATQGQPGQHYILGSENLEWREVHALVARLAGVEPPCVVLNHSLSYLAAGAEEVYARVRGRSPYSTREQAAMIGRYYWYDHAKAAGLGYRPQPASEALAAALSWLAMSPHVSRELRASLRLHDDVYAVRYARGDRAAVVEPTP